MFRTGSRVFHPEYGLGTFREVFGTSVRVAVIEFAGRGPRWFTLPARDLIALRPPRRERIRGDRDRRPFIARQDVAAAEGERTRVAQRRR
jgi:hypothetical protein